MNSPQHIGLIVPALAGVTGPGSGIGVHFRHLADGLAVAGRKVTCVLAVERPLDRTPSGLPFELVVAVARPPRILPLAGKINWQLHRWLMLRAQRRAVAKASTSVAGVQVWETTSTDAPALGFLSVRSRAPVVTRVSTTARQLRATNGGAPNWIGGRAEAWERAAIRQSDAVITHTPGHRAALADEFSLNTDEILLVPHGIPLPPAPSPRAPSPEPRILYVGRFEHRKGVDLLLAALPLALADHPNATVDLVGLDPGNAHESAWRQSAPPDIAARVRFRGVLSDDEVARAYAEADIFVAPSRYESFGLIFVEAMARALPVVALAAPGALDIVEPEKTGLLSPPEDAGALALALRRLLADPALRSRLGSSGRRLAETRYSREALVDASLRAYQQVLVQ